MIVALSGVLRVPVPVFVLFVAIAKTGRYMRPGLAGALGLRHLNAPLVEALRALLAEDP